MAKYFFDNKTVLITGGTGSLGRAIIRKLKHYNCKIVVYSRDEGKQALYFGQDPSITRVIGDVRDYETLVKAFKRYKPNYVIHTAALKRIDDMEYFPQEAIKTNIQGSINVANAALEAGVDKCILVSTDKACAPINVYGASKFTAERLFSTFDYESDHTIFSSVRYGNVIASRGSFIPLWLNLLEQNKPIKVTSLECTRFLFSLEDAVHTVLASLINSKGGEVFIPYFDSYTMEDIIKVVGEIAKKEVEYEVIGMRPGEKFHEDMIAATELPFTYHSEFPFTFTSAYCNQLLCVLPQYTKKEYGLKKYEGREFSSALFINHDTEHLYNLITKGLYDAKLD
jgi:UDP-N-acetylglucosamine 4,6-dehydratase/5-epimerase